MSLIQNFKDRVPTEVLANGAVRYEQFDSNGDSLGYVYMKRADEPTEAGNAWNKTLYDGIKDEFGNVVYTSEKASQSDAETGTDDTKYMTALKTKQAITKFGTDVSIKTGTVAHNGTIPQTDGYSHYLYFASVASGGQSYGGSTVVSCSVNQSSRKVTCQIGGNSATANYLEFAWN